MKGEELGKLLLDELLVAQNGRLVTHYCGHIGFDARPCPG